MDEAISKNTHFIIQFITGEWGALPISPVPCSPTYRGSTVQENTCKPKKNEQAINIVDCLFTSCRYHQIG